MPCIHVQVDCAGLHTVRACLPITGAEWGQNVSRQGVLSQAHECMRFFDTAVAASAAVFTRVPLRSAAFSPNDG